MPVTPYNSQIGVTQIKPDTRMLQLRTISMSSVWFHLSWIGWTTTGVLFMVEPTMSAISFVVVISLVFSTLLSLRAPLLCLYLLPLPMMIGPVFVLPIEGIGTVTVGDLYAVILIFRTLFLRGGRLKNSGQLFLLLGTFLLVLSTALSFNLGASVLGLTKILQYALLVRASIILIKQPSNLRNLFTAWVFITTLCAIMMLWNFYNGWPQMLHWGDDSAVGASIDLERFDVLFRPTFFYANIWIPIGLSLLYSLMGILMKIEPSGFKRVLLCITIPINLLAFLMNNTKAMLVPVIVLSVLIVLWFCWKTLTRPKLNLRWIVFLVLITGVSIWFFAGFLITAPQRVALLEQSVNFESVTMRMSVWATVFPKVLDDPLRLLLVGWGPQSTTRQLESAYMQDLLTGSLGNTEGAFDSIVVGFLVEYGVIFSALIFVYIALWLSRTWWYYRLTKDTFALVLLVMSTALVVAHIFQQFGLSPAGLMALQIFAFLPIFKRTHQRVL